MALFTIADPHLSFGADKPMDVFRGWDHSTEKLKENFEALLGVIVKARPAAVKGTFIQSCTISSNMGPGIKVDVA